MSGAFAHGVPTERCFKISTRFYPPNVPTEHKSLNK